MRAFVIAVASLASLPLSAQFVTPADECARVFGQSVAACKKGNSAIPAASREAANNACIEKAIAAKQSCVVGPSPSPLGAPLAKTGQTISYAVGDDGAVQAGVANPVPRFTDNADGTVTDALTSLVWTKDGSAFFIGWYDGLNYCNQYPTGVPTGWRMPNIRELMSLLDFGQKLPMLPTGSPFINVNADVGNYFYWSSTTNPVYDSGRDVHAVNFGTGEVRIWPKNAGGYLLCVKSR